MWCKHKYPFQHTAIFNLPSPLLTNLMKANSSKSKLLFSQWTFLFQSQRSPAEILGKPPGMCEKKANNLLSIMACFQAPRSLLGAESAPYLSKSELLCRFPQHHRAGSFNLLAYSFCFHFSASYHCRRKARWMKHPVWFIKLNCSPSLMVRSPCRYKRAGTGTYCWLAAGSAGLHSNFPHGNLLGCYLKQDLQIHQLGPDTRSAAMQRLNHL